MTASKPTKIVLYPCVFLISGIIFATLAHHLYLRSREYPINSNILFDGIEEVPILVVAFVGAGSIGVFVLRVLFKNMNKKT